MASVYVIFSRQLNRFYIGSCLDLEYRFNQHQNKQFNKSFTSKADDWVLFFQTDNLEYAHARRIEQHIKKMRSKTYIKNLKKFPEMLEKLKLKYV